MSEKRYLSSVIETTLEMDCDKEFIEIESMKFTLTLAEDGSFRYAILEPIFDSKGKITSFTELESGNIGFGLARLLKKSAHLEDIIERLSVNSYHDVINKCQELTSIGFD